MVVRVHRLLAPQLASKDLNRSVRDDLSVPRRNDIMSHAAPMKIARRPTSLTFMLVCVPEPVWKTTRGK